MNVAVSRDSVRRARSARAERTARGESMTNICIIVADDAGARIFLADENGVRFGELSLVDTFAPDNMWKQHRLDMQRHFGAGIAGRVAALVNGWRSGSVVLVAEPRLLGLMREGLRDAVKSEIALKELAKNYAQLSGAELREHLASSGLVRSPGGMK
jgi:alkanesulfonate monooxygenase SsuD/methylene tetrahydromethanopterin reductase-like flavin-dependent oxidoreductase (luciferase family)